MTAQLTDGFANSPQLRIVGVCLEATLIGKGEHLVVDLRRITDTQHIDAAIHQLLRYPVDSHIALCTYQHLILTHQRLTDSFYQRGGLTRSRGTMNNGYVLGAQHHIDCLLLRGIQIREVNGWKAEGLWLLTTVEQVAQIAQTTLTLDSTVERLHHQSVAGLIERKLYT